MSNNSEDSTLFVFYTLNRSENWTYEQFPENWWWVGSGSTSSINGPTMEYEREEQFNGPLESREQMREYLCAFFESLREKGIVKKFKIRDSFSP